MGHWSVFAIGEVTLAWKYRIPPFLTFLFEPGELRQVVPPEDQEFETEAVVEFRASVAQARERMDALGYTPPFFATVCELMDVDIDEQLVDLLADVPTHGADAGAEARRRMSGHPKNWAADIEAFVEAMRAALQQRQPPFQHDAKLRFSMGDVGRVLVDLDGVGHSVSRTEGQTNPGVARVGVVLDELLDGDGVEAGSLFLSRLLLEVVDVEGEVRLDLADIWDLGDNYTDLPAELADELVRKMQVLNTVFATLSNNEADIRRRVALIKARTLLAQSSTATDRNEKGRLLEDLMATIFESHPGLTVAERRLHLGDQEIDLVVKNNVDRALWQRLDSPLILVECKNWSAHVGADEFRDFETKVRDHQPHAKLAFFVALGGVSGEVDTAKLRASREPYRIVVLDGDDLNALVDGGLNVLGWIENKVSKLDD